jgi:hypothetical protein
MELRERVGATIYLGAAAKASYAFAPLADGEHLEFGRLRLKVLESGHPAQSFGGTDRPSAQGPSASGVLCRRLPIVHRGEFVAKVRIPRSQRNRRWDCGLGSSEAAGADWAAFGVETSESPDHW